MTSYKVLSDLNQASHEAGMSLETLLIGGASWLARQFVSRYIPRVPRVAADATPVFRLASSLFQILLPRATSIQDPLLAY